MKKILFTVFALILFFVGALTTQAASVNLNWIYDTVANTFQPALNAASAVIKGSSFQASSTTQVNTFPLVTSTSATTTNLTITGVTNQPCIGTNAAGVVQSGTCSGGSSSSTAVYASSTIPRYGWTSDLQVYSLAESLGYNYPSELGSTTVFTDSVKPLWIGISATGSYQFYPVSGPNPYGWSTTTQKLFEDRGGKQVMPFVSDVYDPGTGVKTMFESTTTRNAWITAVVADTVTYNWRGITLDIEGYGNPTPWTATDNNYYKAFVLQLCNALHAQGKICQVYLPPLWNTAANAESGSGDAWDSANSSGYYVLNYQEYDALGVDFIEIPLYDYEFDYGAETPEAPLRWITDVANFAKLKIDRDSKIVIGISAQSHYGASGYSDFHDWTYKQAAATSTFGNRTRDAASGELYWLCTGSINCWAADDTTMDLRRSVIEAAGIQHVSVWYLGDGRYGSTPDSVLELERVAIGTTTSTNILFDVWTDLGRKVAQIWNDGTTYFFGTTSMATTTIQSLAATTTSLRVTGIRDNSNSLGTVGQVLQSNGTVATWAATSTLGLGDVVGPVSAVNGALAIFNGTTGKLIQNYNISTFLNDYGIDNGALNARDTANRNRANHTGTQSSTTITGLGTLAGLSSISLTSNVTGILPIANGGTGTSTYATGDMIYASGVNTLAKRAIGTTGDVLSVVAGIPTWVATSTLGITGGGGGFADPLTTNGDIIARISGSTTRLPQGSNGQYLGVSGGVLGYYTPSGSGTINSGTAGQVPYYAANGTTLTGTSSIFITPTGYVGISSSSPTAALGVSGDVDVSGWTYAAGGLTVGDLSYSRQTYPFTVVGTNNTTGIGDLGLMGSVNLGTTDGNTIGFQHGQQASGGAVQTTAGWDFIGNSHTNGAQSTSIAWSTRNAGAFGEGMRLTFDRKLGIGSTTPASALGVTGTTTSTGYRANGVDVSSMVFTNATRDFVTRGASAALTTALSDETGSGVAVFGTSPTFTTQIVAPLVVGGTAVGSTLTLKSTSGAGTSDAIIALVGNNGSREAFRALTTGATSFGSTTPTAGNFVTIASTTAIALYVRGTTTHDGGINIIGLPTSTAGNAICIVGNLVVTAGNTTCVTSSLKTKTDIEQLTSDKWRGLLDIETVAFNYKDRNAVRDAGGKRLGFIAEQVIKVYPELGQYDENGDVSAVHYDGMTALTVEAIQDLQKQIDGITGKAQKSAQDNRQWIVLGIMFACILGQQVQISKLKK